MWFLSFSLCVFFVCYTSGAHNLIQYGNFENGNYSNKWHCNGGCTLLQSSDSFSGHKSLKTSNRYVVFAIMSRTVFRSVISTADFIWNSITKCIKNPRLPKLHFCLKMVKINKFVCLFVET